MIATVSPLKSDLEESICTLRYASRVKYIRNKLSVNIETKHGLIEAFEEEIARLKRRVSLITLREQVKLNASSNEAKNPYEEELEVAEREKDELTRKIETIRKKILIGGENLLEKAQQQLFLLEVSGAELENLNRSHQELEEQIQQKEIEKVDFARRYTDLQEENRHLTDQICMLQGFLNKSKEEYNEKSNDHQSELEILFENSKSLDREIQLADTIVRNYIPKMLRKTVEGNVVWNPDIDDYHVRGLQFTGNNMREDKLSDLIGVKSVERDISGVYGSYSRKRDS